MKKISVRHRLDDKIVDEDYRSASLVPVLAYCDEDHLFLMDDQTLGFGFICQPIPGGDVLLQERVNGFLKQNFPAETTMQFILFRSPDINRKIYDAIGLRDNYKDDMLNPIMKARVEFLKKQSSEKLYAYTKEGLVDNGYLFDLQLLVTCKFKIKSNRPTKDEIKDIRKYLINVESSLKSSKLQPRNLTAIDYLRTMNVIFNWSDNAAWKAENVEWDEKHPICEQVFDYNTDIEVDNDCLRLGEQYCKVLSAKKLPGACYFGDAMKYAGDLSGNNEGIRDHYMVVSNIFFPDSEKERRKIETKRQITVSQAYGPMLKFVPILGDKKQGFDNIYDSLKDGNKPVKMSYSLVVFADSKKKVQDISTKAQSVWRDSGFEIMEDKFINFPMFLNCLPFSTDREAVRDLYRYKTMTTEQAAVLIPIFGEWKGTGTPHILLHSRNGQIMTFSLHDSDTNKNIIVSAEAGGGKSFFVNEILLSYLSEGAIVWVIDIGKSFQKLCEKLNGDFIHFGDESCVKMNPFELVNNYADDEDSLVSLVTAMASPEVGLDDYQTASLKIIMNELWDKKDKKMTVDDIALECRAHNDQRIKDIGVQLFPFTLKGNYGKYFDSNNINFKNKFTVLELDDLQGRTHLRQIILLQLIYQMQQQIYLGNRHQRTIVFIDEGWELLREDKTALFMESAYRKFRKYGASMGISTQSINDLYSSPTGVAMIENSNSLCMLRQKEETIDALKKEGRLSLSDGSFRALKRVHSVKGAYSEIFIKTGRGMGVGRLIVSEYQKLLYSTDPEDKIEIDSVKESMNISTERAIYEIAKKREIEMKKAVVKAEGNDF